MSTFIATHSANSIYVDEKEELSLISVLPTYRNCRDQVVEVSAFSSGMCPFFSILIHRQSREDFVETKMEGTCE